MEFYGYKILIIYTFCDFIFCDKFESVIKRMFNLYINPRLKL